MESQSVSVPVAVPEPREQIVFKDNPNIHLLTSRFNSETWNENEMYRNKMNISGCIYGAPLQVAVKGPKILRVTSRLLFENWMGDEEAYRLQLKEGKDIFGTYYFSTDRSDKSSLKSNDEIVPGKWRTCEIKLSEGDHIITVKVLEKDKTVLLRFLEFN